MGNGRENKESCISEAFRFHSSLMPVVGTVPLLPRLKMSVFLGQSGDSGPGPISWS